VTQVSDRLTMLVMVGVRTEVTEDSSLQWINQKNYKIILY